MNYPQNLTIPIIQLRPRMNSTEWDKSDSPKLSAMNIRNEKTFQSSELPFTIKKLERNPKDILEKRAAMTEREGKEKFLHTDGGDKAVRNCHEDHFDNIQYKDKYMSKKSKDIQDLPVLTNHGVRKDKLCKTNFLSEIETEIEAKLFYLDIIQQLKQFIEIERILADNEKIKYLQKIELLEQENDNLIKLNDENRKAENLAVKSQQMQEKDGEFHLDLLLNDALDVDDKSLKTILDNNLVLPQGPCMKFSNLFDLSGQLNDFCLGEFGSKFVIKRLKDGASPEKEFAMRELKLPSNLLLLLENQYSTRVASTLATIEHQGRADIMSYIEEHSSLILSKSYGLQLITDVLSSTTETEKMCVARSALKSISKLQCFSDGKLD